jgi:hypothetical protein
VTGPGIYVYRRAKVLHSHCTRHRDAVNTTKWLGPSPSGSLIAPGDDPLWQGFAQIVWKFVSRSTPESRAHHAECRIAFAVDAVGSSTTQLDDGLHRVYDRTIQEDYYAVMAIVEQRLTVVSSDQAGLRSQHGQASDTAEIAAVVSAVLGANLMSSPDVGDWILVRRLAAVACPRFRG